MSLNNHSINHCVFEAWLIVYGIEKTPKYAGTCPSTKSFENRIPIAEILGQIPPQRTCDCLDRLLPGPRPCQARGGQSDPKAHEETDDDGKDTKRDILTALPFIAFSRNTWLGARIHTSLRAHGIQTNQLVELDSINAIENLVAHGFDVSVVPQHIFSDDLGTRVKSLAFPLRNNDRVLNLVTQQQNDRQSVQNALVRIVTDHRS